MAEYTEDLALIVRYDGTKAAFEAVKKDYLGKVVFIYGSKTEVTNQAGLVQAIWVSDETGGRYLDMANVEYIRDNLTHISGITVDGKTYYPSSGGGAITLVGANGINVTVNTATGAVTFDGQALKDALIGTTTNNSNTTTHPDTIKGAKAYTDKVAGDLKGTKATGDTTAETIRGAKDYADAKVSAAKTELKGTTSDTKDSETIAGAKKYADAAKAELLGKDNDNIEDNTILGVKNYAKQLATAGEVHIEETAGTGDIGKVYTFYQGGTSEGYKIGVINTPKELVVKSGSVVVNPTGQPNGTYIELTIQNQDAPLYINVADLVDVYTAQQKAVEVQVAISVNNEISATIVAGAVTEDKIASNAVTTGKIANDAVTEDKIADAVLAKINRGNTSVQDISGGDFISVTDTSGQTNNKSYEVSAKTKTMEAAKADILLDGEDALATAHDVYNFIKARLSVKVVS